MTLTANSAGVVTGKFTIPANIPAGTKALTFLGQNGSYGTSKFYGQGTLQTDVRTLVTSIITTYWQTRVDPLAQTFTLTESLQLEGVDLFFTAVGTTPVAVQIRETQVGYPTQTIVADSRVVASSLTANAWNRFSFTTPARLEAGVEYAIVVLCNDAVSALGMAELGKYDSSASQWVTTQPYTVGVLLASSNASTWTAYQDRDLAFRLIARQYTETEKVVDLGTVTVASASELLTLALIDNPQSSATGELELTLPDGTIVKAGDNQRIGFNSATSGTVGVKARLRSDGSASATLYPGTQIIQGQVHSTDTYISDAIDADAAGATVKVIFNAIIPSGANVVAHVSGVDVGDTWQTMTALGTPKLINGDTGLYEYQFQRTSVTEARVRVRLTLTRGGVAVRPHVQDLRLLTL